MPKGVSVRIRARARSCSSRLSRHSSSVVEHPIRNRAVVGSIPTCGSGSPPHPSLRHQHLRRRREWPRGALGAVGTFRGRVSPFLRFDVGACDVGACDIGACDVGACDIMDGGAPLRGAAFSSASVHRVASMRPPRSPEIRIVAAPGADATPLYQRLYAQLREHILSGALPAGSRLPSARTLAADLTLSRNTVEAALAQLRAEGFIERRIGSGTVVAATMPDTAPFGRIRPAARARTPRRVSGPQQNRLARATTEAHGIAPPKKQTRRSGGR